MTEQQHYIARLTTDAPAWKFSEIDSDDMPMGYIPALVLLPPEQGNPPAWELKRPMHVLIHDRCTLKLPADEDRPLGGPWPKGTIISLEPGAIEHGASFEFWYPEVKKEDIEEVQAEEDDRDIYRVIWRRPAGSPTFSAGECAKLLSDEQGGHLVIKRMVNIEAILSDGSTYNEHCILGEVGYAGSTLCRQSKLGGLVISLEDDIEFIVPEPEKPSYIILLAVGPENGDPLVGDLIHSSDLVLSLNVHTGLD